MAVALLVAILCLLFAMLCLLFAFISDKGTVIRQGSSFISAFSLAICVLVSQFPFLVPLKGTFAIVETQSSTLSKANWSSIKTCTKYSFCIGHASVHPRGRCQNSAPRPGRPSLCRDQRVFRGSCGNLSQV